MASAIETSVELAPLAVWPFQTPSGHGISHLPEDRTDSLSQNTATGTATAAPANAPMADSSILSALSIALIMTPLCLSVLLSSLDLTMVTPAIPSIAGSFHSSSGFVWVGGAFVLASTAITPVWGAVADIWGRKPIMLLAQVFFFVGSLMCALAPSMSILIAGRSVQGVGASGMGMMVNTIVCDTFSMRDRGLYLALTSAIWAVGSAVGPIIGGLLTTKSNWRWCFWLNLTVGGVVIIVLLVFLKVPSPSTPILAGLKAIDWTGGLLIVGSALMVLLGLDFGGITFPWSSATVICLLVFGLLISGCFIVNEWKLAANPLIPLRLFTNVSSLAAYVVYVSNFAVLIGLCYYLPLYSQSVLGANALDSGLQLLPLIVSSSVAAACAGIFIQKTGVYLPVMYGAQILLILGSGLFINLEAQQSLTKMILFQIVAGLGVGANMEPPLLAAQATVAAKDTAAVIATMCFLRSIVTALAIVGGGIIFQDQMQALNDELAANVGREIAHEFNGNNALANIQMISSLTLEQQSLVTEAYLHSLRGVWIMCVVIAGISLLSNFFVRGHHLSADNESVVLGLERTTQENTERERQLSTTNDAPLPRTINQEEGSQVEIQK